VLVPPGVNAWASEKERTLRLSCDLAISPGLVKRNARIMPFPLSLRLMAEQESDHHDRDDYDQYKDDAADAPLFIVPNEARCNRVDEPDGDLHNPQNGLLLNGKRGLCAVRSGVLG
jgi:hypothetical protein